MKKFLLAFLFLILFTSSCKNKDALHLGANALINEIEFSNNIIIVSDFGEEKIFGQYSKVDCSKAVEEGKIIYYDNESKEVKNINFGELKVGDEITIDLYEKEIDKDESENKIAEQIQLKRQRLK